MTVRNSANNNMIDTKQPENIIQSYAMGIDISSDYAQVSYVTTDSAEPKSLSTIQGETRYLIPTLMYKIRNSNDWCIGDEAKLRAFEDNDEKYTVRNLLERIYQGEAMYLDDMKYTPEELLKIFVEKLIYEAKRLDGVEAPKYISVTVEKTDKIVVDAIYDVLKSMGYEEAHIRVLSHTESFIYYTLNQKRELWTNDVALFDFNSERFTYRKLSIARNKQPNIVSIVETDYSTDIDLSYIGNDRDKRTADEKFLAIIKDEFYKQIVTTVFLTGVGFYSDFAENSLVELCSKRRVFKGYNLFVKGACYDAMARYNKKELLEYVIQCEGRTKANIGLMINHRGRNTAITLAKAGSNWYEAGARAECILDNVKSIQLVLTSPYGDYAKNVKVSLEDFPDRPNKTTRVAITLSFRDDDVFDVVVEDLGFGDFYKATHMIVKNTYSVSEIFI